MKLVQAKTFAYQVGKRGLAPRDLMDFCAEIGRSRALYVGWGKRCDGGSYRQPAQVCRRSGQGQSELDGVAFKSWCSWTLRGSLITGDCCAFSWKVAACRLLLILDIWIYRRRWFMMSVPFDLVYFHHQHHLWCYLDSPVWIYVKCVNGIYRRWMPLFTFCYISVIPEHEILLEC